MRVMAPAKSRAVACCAADELLYRVGFARRHQARRARPQAHPKRAAGRATGAGYHGGWERKARALAMLAGTRRAEREGQAAAGARQRDQSAGAERSVGGLRHPAVCSTRPLPDLEGGCCYIASIWVWGSGGIF